jgi:hypothetical protein
MSQVVQEVFSPIPVAANGGVVLIGANGGALGGFLCTTSGNLKISYGQAGAGAAIVDTMAVVAGNWYPMPFGIPAGVFAFAQLSAGAAGSFGVA